ncbi:hypothetical protein H0H81_002799 [Sphagnurus paluster]|uniref:DNA 3'-5' helicase n=1 Tax=Sphagnurus paluster TaxID=117069 RepID=A0A9P7K1G0_9AGAR|nr:hypothetical protein H0H81_002799 [Sphagnurus paluster]
MGKGRTGLLKMGTFHALCARFLRIHAALVGLDVNFTICDSDESKKIISALIKKHKEYIEDNNLTLSESGVLSMISKAKAKGHTTINVLPDSLAATPGGKEKVPKISGGPLGALQHIMGIIFEEYERTLRRNNSLDFDDLLVYGVRLFAGHKHTVAWCKYVLVDEFQDTNTTQYDLMIALAIKKHVTVVGDPDQSIYGWRSAEVENLAKMCRDFCGTNQILLEENYRSTASILRASLAIVAQDKTRIQKSLHTSHPAGSTPFLRAFPGEHMEALFIALEIKRLVAHMGGGLRWGDFAILLRFNALSRAIESALQKHGIPSRVLGGHKFFERQEIKNVLAYLQLVDNPNFNPSLVRAANVPSRGIGDKTLQEIAARAEKSGVSQLSIMEGICDGKLPDMKPSAKRKLTPFVKTIRTLRDLANKGTSPADLIRKLVDLVEFESHLRKTQPDWESRWENVKELITFASEMETNIIAAQEDVPPNTDGDVSKDTPLRLFLQASMLSSEGDNQSEEENNEKVTISTCHAAKGLEWPVVMVPSVEDGTFPFARSEDVDEERRLLYVACTRAQGLLYLSCAKRRTIAGIGKDREVSPFISAVVEDDPALFTETQPMFLSAHRRVICNILNRPLPTDAEVAHRVAEFEKTTQHYQLEECLRESRSSSSYQQEIPVEITTNFTSSSSMLRNAVNPIQESARTTHQTDYNRNHQSRLNSTIGTSTASRTQPVKGSTSYSSSRQTTLNTASALASQKPSSVPRPPSFARANTRPSRPAAPAAPARYVITAPRFIEPSVPQMHPLLQNPNTGLPRRDENIPQRLPQTAAVVPPPVKTSQTMPLSDAYVAGTKRRLGMGRGGGGYANKKFKPPT